ncbi:MAG: hypothetical protein ABIQ24_09735 [Nitrospiraceae bacterium]
MRATGWTRGLMVLGLGGLLIAGCAAGLSAKNETPGQRFDREMKLFAENCAKAKLKPNDTACDILKLKSADPLATEEGRFAHSIEIPNLVPEDSGYKPGMTPEQYFDHLCKTEAGEFIYKTVENVDGLYLMRIRKRATDYEMEHLYALEAPYIEVHGEYYSPEEYFVQPHMGKYHFLEMPLFKATKSQDGIKYRRYYRDENAHPGRKYQTAINGQSVFVPYIVAETETESLKSKYGITWRGITLPHDRELGIAGSELIILDLGTNEVLAVRRGFKRTGGVRNNSTGIWWLAGQTCPKLSEKPDHWFIRDVLRPAADLKAKEK